MRDDGESRVILAIGNAMRAHSATTVILLLASAADQMTDAEYVPSKQNWSDGLSRNGAQDSFIQEHAITCADADVPKEIWQGTAQDAWELAKRCA